MARKKKYEKIECSNEHIFKIDYDGVIKTWKCVVMEDEVVTYEGGEEKKHLKITNRERAPRVLQIDTVTTIYGEQIPFQLENGVPFIKLEGEWVPSETFREAKQQAAVKMYKRYSLQETIAGVVCFVIVLAIKLLTGDIGDWWMLTVFGVFFCASAAMRMARLHNELQAIKEAEAEAAAEEVQEEEDGESAVAAARAALEAAKNEE